MDFSRYKTWKDIAITVISVLAIVYVVPNIFNSSEDIDNDIENYYSYYDAVGNKVVINLFVILNFL